MGDPLRKIGVVALGSRLDPAAADRVSKLAQELYPNQPPNIVFHPQCFESWGHFAGTDEARSGAFLDVANDESFDALWFARGGYGACRLVERILPQLDEAAAAKTYLGYSDAGTVMAGLYGLGFSRVAHGPMPTDINRREGQVAVERALRYLVEGVTDGVEGSLAEGAPAAAFNMIIFSQLLGTPWQPDLKGHVLMLEEVSEYMYRIDRTLCHITSNPAVREVAGIRLGRCSDIPDNDPDFKQTEEDVVQHWCEVSGIPYLGRADIGHDIENKIVPFGTAAAVG